MHNLANQEAANEDNIKIKLSKSTNELLTTNINRLNKLFPIGTITNKLYRFTKKPSS